SSTYAYLGKLLKGFSGAVVEYLSRHGYTLMEAYGMFFVGAGAIGLPAVILCVVLSRLRHVPLPAPGQSVARANKSKADRGRDGHLPQPSPDQTHAAPRR